MLSFGPEPGHRFDQAPAASPNRSVRFRPPEPVQVRDAGRAPIGGAGWCWGAFACEFMAVRRCRVRSRALERLPIRLHNRRC